LETALVMDAQGLTDAMVKNNKKLKKVNKSIDK
jgi:hypothetical protein